MGLTPQAMASALPRPRTLQRPPVRKVHQCVSSCPQVCITAQLIGCCHAAAAPGHTEERRGLLSALPPPSTSGAAQLFAGVPAPKQRAKLPVSFRLPTRAPIDSDDEVRTLQGTGSVYSRSRPLVPLQRRERRRRSARRRRRGRPPRACGSPTSCPRPPTTLRSRSAPARRAAAPSPALLAAAALLPAVPTRPLTRPRGPAAR